MNSFRFPKGERLKSRKRIAELFANGTAMHLQNLRVIYSLAPTNQPNTFEPIFGFSVPKRSFKKATQRQLLKRRLKEAYRINRQSYFDQIKNQPFSLEAMVLYQSHKLLTFDIIQQDVCQMLEQLVELIKHADQ